MRADALIDEVLSRCDALKAAGFWPAEPLIRPRAWLENFDLDDRLTAATLLERFNYFNYELTDRLLCASFDSLCDNLPKSPANTSRETLQRAIDSALFTPVEGEKPNVTDSGNYLCRRVRQKVGIPEARIVPLQNALEAAIAHQTPIVFVDDFIGSGDQFLHTWRNQRSATIPPSFASAHRAKPFPVIYLALIATKNGISNIHARCPHVNVSCAHVIDESATFRDIRPGPSNPDPDIANNIQDLLIRYSRRLKPTAEYMYHGDNLVYGYGSGGLMLAFAHSVPDSTLPIFWSTGTDWNPLIQRS